MLFSGDSSGGRYESSFGASRRAAFTPPEPAPLGDALVLPHRPRFRVIRLEARATFRADRRGQGRLVGPAGDDVREPDLVAFPDHEATALLAQHEGDLSALAPLVEDRPARGHDAVGLAR